MKAYVIVEHPTGIFLYRLGERKEDYRPYEKGREKFPSFSAAKEAAEKEGRIPA